MRILIFITSLSLLTVSVAGAHSVEYQVENRGISARFFFLPNDPASYSPYEVFGPGDTVATSKGTNGQERRCLVLARSARKMDRSR